jgi:hypothetical protein
VLDINFKKREVTEQKSTFALGYRTGSNFKSGDASIINWIGLYPLFLLVQN